MKWLRSIRQAFRELREDVSFSGLRDDIARGEGFVQPVTPSDLQTYAALRGSDDPEIADATRRALVREEDGPEEPPSTV